jgi:type IV conjugative transfer system protein TraE
MSKTRYTDIIANAFSEVRAWKLTTIALACLCAVMAFALIYQTRSTPVILVPYGMATETGKLTVSPAGNFAGTTPQYLSQVALGDLALILNWQPDNVALQYQRFLNRTTSELFARENVRLLEEAKDHQNSSTSQSFYPERVEVDLKNGKVVVNGYLIRWSGEKEVIRTRTVFTVTYRMQQGFLHVANLEMQK